MGLMTHPARFAVITAIGSGMMAIYLVINRNQAGATTVVDMPGWVPFLPVLALPYLALLGVAWLLPLAIRDGLRFRACLLAATVGFILCAPWWILTPTEITRPPAPPDWWAAPWRWLIAVDRPTNITPCAHAVGPAVAAWFAGRDRPAWRWWLAAMLGLGLPTIAMTWQHRPVDILLGMSAAGLGVLAGELWIRRARRQTAPG
jgi:hypothetical protein